MKINSLVIIIILSLSNATSSFGVTIHEGHVVDDIAETERVVGKTYTATQDCRITFDNNNLNAALVKFRSKYINISSSKLRDFILIHEVAHCFDGVQTPVGVDEIEWREYFADIYSAVELYRAGEITRRDYDQLIKLRNSSTQSFTVNALHEGIPLLAFSTTAPSIELATAVKELRDKRFGERRSV